MNMIDKIRDKLTEYDFAIYDQYEIENGEYLFLVDDMLIFVNNELNLMNVSFQATTKPDVVATNILILKEIPELLNKNIGIMDSFIFTRENEMVQGDKAFELIEKTIADSAIKQYNVQLTYEHILTNSKDMPEC